MVNELIASGFIRPIERRGRKALVLAENPRGQAVMKLVEAVKQPPTLTSNDFHRLLLRRSKGEIDALAAVGREAFKRTFEETPLGYRMRTNA